MRGWGAGGAERGFRSGWGQRDGQCREMGVRGEVWGERKGWGAAGAGGALGWGYTLDWGTVWLGGGGSLVLRATSGLGGTVDGGTLVGVWGCSRWVWVKIGWGGGLGG